MENRLWVVIVILAAAILALCIKIYIMRKAAEEIRKELAEKLAAETNTLITISSRDKCMCALAENLNKELRLLNRKRHYFEQGDLRLKEAVVNMSHDIRTPLTALNGYLELLRKLIREIAEGNGNLKEKTETAERYLDIMENRTGVLTQLTEELFHYSIMSSEEQELPYEDVILNHVLEESISAYYAALNNAKITPVINMPDKEVKCRLNKDALARIFGNILGNAIKYSSGDLQISLSKDGEIVFSNHTSALDEVQVGKLFYRFYTVETATKSTGIGLSIAKMLTEQMGGTITADYQKGVLSIRLLFSVSRL